jgi:hypothetical protein
MIGQTINGLTIIAEDIEKNKQLKLERKQGLRSSAPKYYICQCDCGNIIILTKQKIHNRKKSGCSKCAKINFSQYINQRINDWTILNYTKTPYGEFFECKCKCGMIKLVNCYNIINNYSKNCGCGRKETLSQSKRKDMIGKKFGKLTVMNLHHKNQNGKLIYECVCECGNKCYPTTASLISGHTQSCGCLVSKYNSLITQYISDLGYIPQNEFHVNINHQECSYVRFDVYIDVLNLAIEYDGEGHYIPIDFGGGDPEYHLQQTQIRDKIKTQYCIDNNIHLLRIPYWEKENFKDLINDTINKLITNND